MRVFVTKYALTTGIISFEVLHLTDTGTICVQGPAKALKQYLFKGEYCLTLPEAEIKVKDMLAKRIIKLEKQLVLAKSAAVEAKALTVKIAEE